MTTKAETQYQYLEPRPGSSIVIGPKKLSTIRQELRRDLESTGLDPIDWLEARITATKLERPNSSDGTEVLESLARFLGKKPRTRSRVKRRLGSKS